MSDTKASPATPDNDERLAYRGVFQQMLIRPEIGAAIGAIAIWVFFWAVADKFGTASGVSSVLDVASSPLGIMAVAVALLMIGGEFDLSAGAATGAFGILLVLMVRDVVGDSAGWGLSLWVALPLSLLAAIFLGWFNGTVVDRTGLPSFIVTLASFFVLKGAKLGYSKQIVDQIQVGRLDQLLITADERRRNALLEIHEVGQASGAEQQALLDDLGVELSTPVPELLNGNGTFADLLDALARATENQNLSELDTLSVIARRFVDESDGGYSTLNDIFAFDWIRNEHIWEWRDWVYVGGVLLGLSLLALSIYEMHFRRRDEDTFSAGILPLIGSGIVALGGLVLLVIATITNRPDNNLAALIIAGVCIGIIATGAVTARRYLDRATRQGVVDAALSMWRIRYLVTGAAIAVVGIARLHRTDSVSGNVQGAVLIALGMVVGFGGWCWRRYERGVEEKPAPEGEGRTDSFVAPLGFGLASLVVGMILGRAMDSENTTNLVVEWGLNGWLMFLVALAIALLAGAVAALRGDTIAATMSAGGELWSRVGALLFRTAGQSMRTVAILTFVIAMLFLNQSTVQGARAIFLMLLLAAAATGMLVAVNRARRSSMVLGSALLGATAAVVVLTAFYIRWESGTYKFRTEMFSVMLAAAAIMAIWALMTVLFRERRAPDGDADGFARAMAMAGGLAIVVGLVVRLLGVTQAELDGDVGRTLFSVRILWFLAFTAVATWVLGRTRFGSWIFAVGGNNEASRQVGVPAARTKTQLFIIVSVAAWLVGLLLAFRLNTIQASTGDGQEFEFIIAAVVGGNALTGGRGSTLGAAIGAFIMAMAEQGIPSARWNSDWRFVFIGVILLLAVIANNFIRTRAEQAR